MINGTPDIPLEFLQIKKDDKFFSRLLSKESSKRNEPSFRVLYYGGAAGSIPFTWESTPGTPKHTLFSDNALPPLTPPPSYALPRTKTMRNHSKPNFWGSIFPTKSRKKTEDDKLASFSSSSSSSYNSSSHSLPSTTPLNKRSGGRSNGMAGSMPAFQYGVDDEDEHEQVATSLASSLCLRGGGIGRSMKNVMKRAFLSIACHGTS